MLKKIVVFAMLALTVSLTAAETRNIIANPGFENVKPGTSIPLGWRFGASKPDQATFQCDSEIKSSGKYSFRLNVIQKPKKIYNLRQHRRFRPVISTPCQLKISARVRAKDLKYACIVIRGMLKDGKQVVWKNIKSMKGTFDWQTVTAVVNAPAGLASAEISIRMNNTGTLWLDDVSVSAITPDAK